MKARALAVGAQEHSRVPKTSGTPNASVTEHLPLSEVRSGARARMHSHELAEPDLRLLEAIGITLRSEIRVLQQGEPCIVLVRDTRVGLTAPVASRLRVIPIDSELRNSKLDVLPDAS